MSEDTQKNMQYLKLKLISVILLLLCLAHAGWGKVCEKGVERKVKNNENKN